LFSAKLQFLVILTYRDCLLKYKLLNNEDAVVSYIHIKNLDEDALVELIRTTMHRLEEIDTVILTPLVDFIYQRTRGNPFYACQLLMALEKKNLIYFTWEKARWEYNLHEIEKVLLVDLKEESSTVDKDIEFVKSRFKDLPRDGRKFLKWASFIGNTFDYETVRHVMLANGEKWDTLNGLQSVIQQGFIQTFNEEFRFTHDRYSQAAMLLDPEEPDDIYHLTIATYFIHRATDMFWVADHIKAALHLVQKNEIKGDYRKVCLKAGDKAFDSGAHKLAFSYYSAAEKLLDTPNAWKDGVDSKYTETLHIYTRLAEISWFMDYSKTREYLALILKHARSTVDRAAAYRVQHRYRWSRTGNHESALILLECLSELGVCDIELTLSKEELRKVYEATRTQVLKVGWENILQLPVCEDRLVRTRFAILEEVCLWAYWTLDMSAMLSVGARLITKTLTFGTTPSTGVGFVFFGIAAMKLFKVFEFSEQISKIGVDLCDCHGGNSESGRARYLYSNFFNSWKNSYHDSIPLSRLAMKQCLLGGDRIYATFAHLHIVMGNLLCGQNMSYTLREAKTCLEETETFNDSTGAIILATTVIRVILAMQGKTFLTEDALFDDKEFTERAFIQEAQMEPVNTTSQLYYYYAMKSVVLSMYRMDKASIQISADHIHQAETIPSARHTHLLFFFRCISLIRLSRETNVDYMESILDCKSKLEEWAEHSHPDNLTMFISAIDAELASLDSQDLKAQQLYDLAIEQAKNGKWPMESCMMYELAGDYFLRNRFSSFGCTLIEKAISGYRHLGVYGRVNQLTQLYKQVLNKSAFSDQHRDISVQTEPIPSLSKRDSIGDFALSEPESDNQHHQQQQESPEETLLSLDVVDLASIIKSSQVISSEMNFDLLLKQMMGIILENSGAESGVIIVKENTSFLIVAGGSQTDGCEIYHTPKKLQDEADSIVTRISQYAIHSQETLFIVDVKQDSRFSDCTTQAKSCLCTPIIHKSAIVGCIYIEGAIGTLTSRHKTVLQLLSQQIGISVTNALLFKSIQKVTYANVRMIENQKAALEEARKSKEAALHAMKLKSDFLANMSHELRTPFSGFYGMISLLSETTLDAEQLDIVHTAKESCEMLLKIIDDLLNFSKLEAGKVTLDLGPLVVEEVIADTIEILSSLAARKGLELAYIVDQDVPTTIIGDSSRLRQILTNLLGNAIKFTHEGGVVIKCHLDEELDSNFVRLKFEVVDTGIGIREEQQRHLFEPFSQVDGSTTRMYGGTGLGLSICLQLVRLMMGEVGVESDMEWGSNFWFTIAVSKQNQGNKRTSLGLLRNQSVLLAAENDVNATMMYSLLSDFAMRHTKDMQQAVSQALQEHYDILILDIPAKPTPSIAHQLQSVDDDPECELHIVLLYTPSTEGHKLAAEATNSASERRGRLVKVAKPVRRVKLLRLLEQVLDTAPLPSIQPVLGNRMTDHFKKDELAWFYQKPVLIAEDNMVAQKLLKKQLEKMGFIVESANNGEEAVQLWQERPRNYFCLGFFDHHMPKVNNTFVSSTEDEKKKS
jgi:signal transduction histidine kinase/predicted ATPase/CheY-like chemotaxis protein